MKVRENPLFRSLGQCLIGLRRWHQLKRGIEFLLGLSRRGLVDRGLRCRLAADFRQLPVRFVELGFDFSNLRAVGLAFRPAPAGLLRFGRFVALLAVALYRLVTVGVFFELLVFNLLVEFVNRRIGLAAVDCGGIARIRHFSPHAGLGGPLPWWHDRPVPSATQRKPHQLRFVKPLTFGGAFR